MMCFSFTSDISHLVYALSLILRRSLICGIHKKGSTSKVGDQTYFVLSQLEETPK